VLDGAIVPCELAAYVKELGQPAVAITDHGNLHGVIDFYKACKNSEIKPIIGSEIYCTNDEDNTEEKQKDNYHLVVLAKNNEGYRELLYLVSNANLSNFYYKPRVSMSNLLRHGANGNLIVTSACLGGPLAKHLEEITDENKGLTLRDTNQHAEKILNNLLASFKENLYLEIQHNDELKQIPYNSWLVEMAHKYDIKTTIATDAHFLKREDHRLHALMMAMQLHRTIDEYNSDNSMRYSEHNYVKSTEEMIALANLYGVPEAIDNTCLIAEQCNVEIELGKSYPPVFDITKADDYQDFLAYRSALRGKN
jgi:DNA polymerase-3 subunit alpha